MTGLDLIPKPEDSCICPDTARSGQNKLANSNQTRRSKSCNPSEECCDGGFEPLGNHQHGSKRKIGLASLDLSHVAAVDVANVRELFLRPAFLEPQFTDSGT